MGLNDKNQKVISRSRQLHSLLSYIGPIGVYIYIVSFAFPLASVLPLVVLISTSILAAAFGLRNNVFATPRLPLLLISLFLVVTAVAIVTSIDIERSLKYSISLLPALLLFFLVAESFSGAKDLSRLYLCCAVAALGIAINSLWSAGGYDFNFSTTANANKLVWWSPILVSRNDLTVLALIAPLSAVLVCRKPLSAIGIIAALSILLSLVTVVLFQSRGATLTMIFAIACVAVALRSRLALAIFGAVLLVAVLADAWLGFPLVQRIFELLDLLSGRWNPRLSNWSVAWSMFLESPLLGQGPHTYLLFTDDLAWFLRVPWPHNLYLEVLAEAGIFGLLILCALLAYTLRSTWHISLAAQSEFRLLAVGAFGSICGFCLASIYELSFIREWVNLFLFLLVAIAVNLSCHKQQVTIAAR